jgi:hypothetical protein
VLLRSLKSPAAEIDVSRNALHRRLGMELERQPRDVDGTFVLELFDSDRVDVTPGSNVVRKDDEIDRFELRHRF